MTAAAKAAEIQAFVDRRYDEDLLPRLVDSSVAIDGRIRLGLALGPFIPFVYAGTSYGISTPRLTLDDRPEQVTLSRWNVAAGLGLLFSLARPAG